MPDNNGYWRDLATCYPPNNVGLLPGGGNDPFLGVNVHSYEPWDFCTGNQDAYPGCSFYQDIASSISAWSSQTGVAVTLNEYGLYGQPRDSANDHCYLSLMTNMLLQSNIAPAVWNDYGNMAIINNNGDFPNGEGPVVLAGCSGQCGCGC